MTTTVKVVERHLERDLVLKEALARGFLNVRRAARQLIEERGWDASEEAVVSALRRYDPDPSVNLENVFHMLDGSRMTAVTGLAVLTVPRVSEYVSRIPDLAEHLGPLETLGFVPDDECVHVLVDDANVNEVLGMFPGEGDHRVRRGLGRIELDFPETDPLNTAAVAVVLHHLGHRKVDVVAVYCTFPVCTIYVRETGFSDAYDLVKELQART